MCAKVGDMNMSIGEITVLYSQLPVNELEWFRDMHVEHYVRTLEAYTNTETIMVRTILQNDILQICAKLAVIADLIAKKS